MTSPTRDPGLDPAAAEALLTTTRTVRRRLDFTRPVPRDTVLDCVRIAAQAPSGGNSQRWHWILVDDPHRIARLAELYRDTYHEHLAQRSGSRPLDPGTAAVKASSDYLAEHLHRVPVIVIPCVTRRPPPDTSLAANTEFYGSILPAVWSFQLALRSRGLASAFTTVHVRQEAAAAAVLDLPESYTQIALLPVAHSIGTLFRPAPRRPVSDIISWNTWRSP